MNTLAFEEKCRLFHAGEYLWCYDLFGIFKEGSSFVFRTFAPEAESVFLVGSFNDWQENYQMERVTLNGIFEVRIDAEKIREGDSYKYKLYRSGEAIYSSDPFALKVDATLYSNSVVTSASGFRWRDSGWLAQREETSVSGFYAQPLNIYQLDMNSWKCPGGDCDNYRDIARELAPYVKQMGYTHVELLSLVAGICCADRAFAPTSVFGEPKDLMGFVDIMHRAGIGVIFEWSPKCFVDCLRDYSKSEIRSFVASNAAFWFKTYHADGLFVSGMPSMIFDGNGGICEEMAELLREVNRTVKAAFPDVILIAEENEGLGFDLVWNTCWMDSTLSYASTDFKGRANEHGKLTFPINCAFDRKYILPVPRCQVTEGKKSFLDKMPGDYWKKFAGARAFEILKMTFPGKKLTFMGAEIGQFSEWMPERGVEWFLLDFETHARHQLFYSDLNNFYLAHPELWQGDGSPDSFRWIDADDCERNIISFSRVADNSHELIVVINFAPCAYPDYFLPVPEEGIYEEVFNSDDVRYGGSGVTNSSVRFNSMPNPYLIPEKKYLPRE